MALPEVQSCHHPRRDQYPGRDPQNSHPPSSSPSLATSTGGANCSFPYHEELYYIVTDFQKTFLTRIIHRHFETIDTISSVSIWTYDPSVIRTIDNHYLFFFENPDTKGYLDIAENKIALYRYKQ
jgi:hypothetical protein